MLRVVLTVSLAMALGLGLLWLLGGFEAMAGWAVEGQRDAQNAMAGALRRLRAGESGALLALLGIAFAYGFFHAAGPGHGKVLIGGYGAATRVRLTPLAGIALAASLGQATMAVALVYGGIALLEWSREELVALGEGAMTSLSILAIGLIGAWLAWRGARGVLRQWGPAPVAVQGATGAGHAGASGGGPCPDCGHRHAPGPEEVARLTGWRDAALLVGAIAMRPCTGALFLLILTWRMGIEGAGIAGTYAMGLGTATITVGTAALAVLARDGARVWAGRLAGLRGFAPLAELAVGILVVIVAGNMLTRGY